MLAHDGRRWRAPETRGCQGRHLREKGELRGAVLQASGVSELRQGAAGRTTWIPVVGSVDETSARKVFCSISLVRSSRR